MRAESIEGLAVFIDTGQFPADSRAQQAHMEVVRWIEAVRCRAAHMQHALALAHARQRGGRLIARKRARDGHFLNVRRCAELFQQAMRRLNLREKGCVQLNSSLRSSS